MPVKKTKDSTNVKSLNCVLSKVSENFEAFADPVYVEAHADVKVEFKGMRIELKFDKPIPEDEVCDL